MAGAVVVCAVSAMLVHCKPNPRSISFSTWRNRMAIGFTWPASVTTIVNVLRVTFSGAPATCEQVGQLAHLRLHFIAHPRFPPRNKEDVQLVHVVQLVHFPDGWGE